MHHASVQRLMDRLAISGSVLCMLHCLLMPFLLVLLPALSSSLLAEEAFHRYMLAFVLPLSLAALFIGCRSHKTPSVFLLGALGLGSLVLLAFFGHDVLGETGEKVGTIISVTILAMSHLQNFRLCNQLECEACALQA